MAEVVIVQDGGEEAASTSPSGTEPQSPSPGEAVAAAAAGVAAASADLGMELGQLRATVEAGFQGLNSRMAQQESQISEVVEVIEAAAEVIQEMEETSPSPVGEVKPPGEGGNSDGVTVVPVVEKPAADQPPPEPIHTPAPEGSKKGSHWFKRFCLGS